MKDMLDVWAVGRLHKYFEGGCLNFRDHTGSGRVPRPLFLKFGSQGALFALEGTL